MKPLISPISPSFPPSLSTSSHTKPSSPHAIQQFEGKEIHLQLLVRVLDIESFLKYKKNTNFTGSKPRPKYLLMRNPKWHRDEIILALDLYFDPNRGSIDTRNPKVVELSELINRLPLFSNKPDEEKFRNPNGVSLKLSNFLAIDPEHDGRGMSAYSRLDEEVFKEFANDREKLRKVAQLIKQVVQDDDLRQRLYKVEDDDYVLLDSVREGQVLYKLHKYRERNSRIIKAKKDAVLNATGRLACEVCDFDFSEKYGLLGQGFIECHHTQPLSFDLKERVTSIKDLAIVCANCHRMLHRNIDLLSILELKQRLNQTANPKIE